MAAFGTYQRHGSGTFFPGSYSSSSGLPVSVGSAVNCGTRAKEMPQTTKWNWGSDKRKNSRGTTRPFRYGNNTRTAAVRDKNGKSSAPR